MFGRLIAPKLKGVLRKIGQAAGLWPEGPGKVRLKVRTNRRVKVLSGREHWPFVAEGNCVVERRGGEQPEAKDQSINKTMLNSIRPDALASPPFLWRSQDRKPSRNGGATIPRPIPGESSEQNDRSAEGGWR
jgi:hypothetical protein